jgi:hypothetical protein
MEDSQSEECGLKQQTDLKLRAASAAETEIGKLGTD